MDETKVNEIDQINETLSLCRDIDLTEFDIEDIKLLRNDLEDKKKSLEEQLERLYKEDQTANSGKISMIEATKDDLDNLLEEFSSLIEGKASGELSEDENDNGNDKEERIDEEEITEMEDISENIPESEVEEVNVELDNISEDIFESEELEEVNIENISEPETELVPEDILKPEVEEVKIDDISQDILLAEDPVMDIPEISINDELKENTITLTNVPSQEYRDLAEENVKMREKASHIPLDAIHEGERIAHGLMKEIQPEKQIDKSLLKNDEERLR